MPDGGLLHHAKVAYVAGAHRVGSLLARAGVGESGPPSREARLRHWAYSLTRVHDPHAIAELDVPWWTYRAIEYVDEWLRARPRPIRVFEYGSGASTAWLARRVDEIHTVEHDREFAQGLAASLADYSNIEFRVAEPVACQTPAVSSAKEGCAGLDFSDYVGTIDEVGGTFSLIAIDGRARPACLMAALAHLAPGGIIVFDNSRRHRYRAAIHAAPLSERRFAGLTPTLPYPEQTSVLSSGVHR